MTKEIKREITKYFELNENENTLFKNLWKPAKVVFKRPFIAWNIYTQEEKPKISDLSFHLKKLEK